jgi:hypothetical protein
LSGGTVAASVGASAPRSSNDPEVGLWLRDTHCIRYELPCFIRNPFQKIDVPLLHISGTRSGLRRTQVLAIGTIRVAQLSHNECNHRHQLGGSRDSWERAPASVATHFPSQLLFLEYAWLQPCLRSKIDQRAGEAALITSLRRNSIQRCKSTMKRAPSTRRTEICATVHPDWRLPTRG